ncbi:low molecular weight protein-tyrosine-phosphatase [Luteimonas vadosa]|uniref:protein-tyrosine-phosphatase n=1 Tax=Luteimonas vadosa TaxID=1165507 RepID=A0ABP9E3B1_9GAMM
MLVVCLGNICRSPMAEGALRARIDAAGLSDRVEVDSVGTGGWHAGDPPDARAIGTAARHGVDISGLRARQLRPADFEAFDLILCADRANLRDVQARMPSACAARPVLMLAWAGQGHAAEIPDPYSGGKSDFEHAWTLVDAAAEAIVDRLSGNGKPV